MKESQKVKVLISPSTFGVCDRAPIDRLKEEGFEIIDNPYKRRLTKDEVIKLLSDGVEGIIAGLEPLDKEVLEKSNLKVISRCGSGTSNVYAGAYREFEIQVRATLGAPTISVAELTVGAMISLLRQIPQMNMDLHQGKWTKITGAQLAGKTVLIIGFGNIGQRVAKFLKPFEVKLLAVDPQVKGTKLAVKLCQLKEALPEADIITIHAGGTKQILGKEEFKLIRNGIYLLNAARGQVVDEYCLIEALENKKIKGAWIDTFSIEPYNGPLKNYPQVILTPHVGSYTVECRKKMEMQAVENLINGFKKLNVNIK